MTKIVYNTCYGGFSLSKAAINRYAQLKGWTITWEPLTMYISEVPRIAEAPNFYTKNIPRTDPTLIQVVEELGPDANGPFARLAICDLLPGTRYRIDEYDGAETVKTIDDYKWSIA